MERTQAYGNEISNWTDVKLCGAKALTQKFGHRKFWFEAQKLVKFYLFREKFSRIFYQ